MERPLGLSSFDHQSRLAHLLTVGGGVAAFWLGYFGAVFVVYGDVSVVASETSIEQQRVGGIAGGLLVWAYFAVAFVRGYGGPVLNLVYPLAISTLAAHAGRWLLFGVDGGAVLSRFVGLFVLEPLITTLVIVGPGLGAFVAVLTLWAAVIDEGDRREWERHHLTAEFYEEFVAQEYE